MLDSNNHLFELARLGKRLPHIVVAVVLAIVFVVVAQLVGGIPAILLVLLLKTLGGDAVPGNPNDLATWILPETAFQQTIFLILAFGPIFLILWGWLALYEKRPLWTIGMERVYAGRSYIRGLLVGLVMFTASIGISAALGYISIEQGSHQPVGLAALGGVLLLFFGWMVQAAAEEALTRGWLLPVIGARYRPVLGVIISSLLFTFLHGLNPNLSLVALLNLFLFGTFAALYALREGGMWGVFSIHSIWNWAQGNLYGFEVSGNPASGGTLFDLMEVGPDVITGGPFGPEGGLAVTLVLITSCLVVWRFGAKLSPQRPS